MWRCLESWGLLLLLAVPVASQDKATLPQPLVLAPRVKIVTLPIVADDGPVKLDAGTLYILRSAKKCNQFDSPRGVLRVTKFAGPMTFYAKFAVDGTGGFETRTYTEPYIWAIEPVKSGTAEVIIQEVGQEDDSKAFRRLIDANKGPRPPPDPDPDPDPKPSPAPIPYDGFRVLIVENSKKRSALPGPQQVIFGAEEVSQYLDSKCVTGMDGKTKDWRVWPHDAPTASMSKMWSDALKRQPKETQLPWIIISDGKTGFEGALPANVEDTMKLLKKYGG